MAVSEDYRQYIIERLETVGVVTSRLMFGAVGLYMDGLFFALINDNILYFKVDDSNRSDYENADMPPFRPYGGDSKPMSYYEVPADVLENDSELAIWARKAVAVAASKPPKKRKRRK